jgi:hypothetical protein
VVVGYGGGAGHVAAKMPIERLAEIHQPVRPIIVPPDQQTLDLMRLAMYQAVNKIVAAEL